MLVAPSGAGKTTELAQACDAHRQAGLPVAFLRANDATGDTPAELAGIAATPCVLVVDAIDELSIDGMTFKGVLKTLAAWLPDPRNVRLVFSARSGRWNPSHEAELARSPFGIPTGTLAERAKRVLVDIRTLAKLEPEDVVRISQLPAGKQTEFRDAYHAFEVDIDLRPCDVPVLVDAWLRTGAFPGWTEILEAFVERTFREQNDVRVLLLPQAAARSGLERLAAARVLSRKSFVAHPREPVGDDALSARTLFRDWEESKLFELFEHPVLIPKGRDGRAVQLPDNWVAHYLAACWLHSRIKNGLDVGELLARLVVALAGETKRYIPSGWHAVLGWTATHNDKMRQALLAEFPEVVLFEGDPRALSDREVLAGLTTLWSRAPEIFRPSPETLRGLMRPPLHPFVRDRLAHEEDPRRLELLLHLAEVGELDVQPFTKRLLQHPSDLVRETFLRVRLPRRGASASEELVALAGVDSSPHVQATLLLRLPPGSLTPATVVAMFAARTSRDTFPHYAIEWAKQEAVPTRVAFAQLLSERAMTSHHAAKVLFGVMLSLLHTAQDVDEETLFHLLNNAEAACARHNVFVAKEDIARAQDLLAARTTLRQRLLVARYGQEGHHSRYQRRSHPAFGDAQIDDLPLLLTARDEWDHDASFWAGEAAARLFLGSSDRHAELRARFPGLIPKFDEAIAQENAQRERQRGFEAREERRKGAEQRRESAILRSTSATLRSGKHEHNLMFVADRGDLWDKEPEELSLDRTALDPDVLDAVEAGLIAVWRAMEPKFPEPGKIWVSQRLALLGFQFARKAGLKLEALSDDDVRRATIFALSSLNRLPKYLEDLARTHEHVVRCAIEEAIASEWNHPSDVHGAFRLMDGVGPAFEAIAKGIVLSLLATGSPRNAASRRYAVDVLLTSASNKAAILTAIEREREAPFSTDWWRLWANFDPLAAAEATAALWEEGRHEEVTALLGELANDAEERKERPFARIEGEPLVRWYAVGLRCAAPEIGHEDAPLKLKVVRPETRFTRELKRMVERSTSITTRTALKSFLRDCGPEWYADVDWTTQQQLAALVNDQRAKWTEADILALEAGDEKQPRTHEELFAMVQKHLRELHTEMLNGDFSYRELFRRDPNLTDRENYGLHESDLQRWAAAWLDHRARRLYSVVREPQKPNGNMVDIAANVPGIAQVPIEIKPLGKYPTSYSIKDLRKTIDDQLIGKYMRMPNAMCGVLLLISVTGKEWKDETGATIDRDALLQKLTEHAQAAGAKLGKQIAVCHIDLISDP